MLFREGFPSLFLSAAHQQITPLFNLSSQEGPALRAEKPEFSRCEEKGFGVSMEIGCDTIKVVCREPPGTLTSCPSAFWLKTRFCSLSVMLWGMGRGKWLW